MKLAKSRGHFAGNNIAMARRSRERGSELVEVAVILPLLLFMLIGVFDLGFYMYAFISVENAARVAVMDTAASSALASRSSLACSDVRNDLASLPNASSFASNCGVSPLLVSAQSVTGPDGSTASQVTLTYTTPNLFTIPWIPGQMIITRSVIARTRS
jgi:Flp pilus assembly protein TadG